MDKGLKRLLLWVGAGVLVLLLLAIVSQLARVHAALWGIHPLLARGVTGLLGVVSAGVLVVPVLGIIHLRKPLDVPDEKDVQAYEEFLRELYKRLSRNRHLQEQGFVFRQEEDLKEQIEAALELLNRRAEGIIHEAASTVFITTAVSQNGVLDGFFVLAGLSRLVWRISHLYDQKPRAADIVHLYANVAVTVLMAREIEDLALLDEQLEPVISSLMGGTLSTLVPGTTAVANLLINSVIEGSANAFLTLRVGAMARRYSAAVTKVDRRVLRRSATLEACSLLGRVVSQNASAIVRAFASASKKATVDWTVGTFRGGARRTRYIIKEIFQR